MTPRELVPYLCLAFLLGAITASVLIEQSQRQTFAAMMRRMGATEP